MADMEPPDEMPEEMKKYWQPGDVVVKTWINEARGDYYLNIQGKGCFCRVYNGYTEVFPDDGDYDRIRWPGAFIIPNKISNPLEVY